MIVQLPLPEGVDADTLLRAIDPRKDVDGLHPENQGHLLQGAPHFLPATPHGVQQLLVRTGNDPGGKHVVIAGRSKLVGMPLAAMLLQKRAGANATVTVCHTGTPDLAVHTRQAEILVAAVGRPGVITADMVRPGAVVIDVGVNRVDDPSRERGYRLVGDVDFDAVRGEGLLHHPRARRRRPHDRNHVAHERSPRRARASLATRAAPTLAMTPVRRNGDPPWMTFAIASTPSKPA